MIIIIIEWRCWFGEACRLDRLAVWLFLQYVCNADEEDADKPMASFIIIIIPVVVT